KGKVERRIRDQRYGCDPYHRHWDSLGELQAWTDERQESRWLKRLCPATGTSVAEAHRLEVPRLSPIDGLPEPFDLAVTRRVNRDCTVQFEGRSYSVSFQHVGREVEIRGCASSVDIVSGTIIIARHPRGTSERVVLNQSHFEGPATASVL